MTFEMAEAVTARHEVSEDFKINAVKEIQDSNDEKKIEVPPPPVAKKTRPEENRDELKFFNKLANEPEKEVVRSESTRQSE